MAFHLSQTFVPCVINARFLSLLDSIEFPLRGPLPLSPGGRVVVGNSRARSGDVVHAREGIGLSHDSCVRGEVEGEEATKAEKARQDDGLLGPESLGRLSEGRDLDCLRRSFPGE